MRFIRPSVGGTMRRYLALGVCLLVAGSTVNTSLAAPGRNDSAAPAIVAPANDSPQASAAAGATVKDRPTVPLLSYERGRLVRGDGIPESMAWEPTGNFRTICSFSHHGYNDPIVYPRQRGKSHLHMFFGNRGTNARSNYRSLRNTGAGSCLGGGLNRSAYWAPAMLNGRGKLVVPRYIDVYYKNPWETTKRQIRSISMLPKKLRMIAGFNMAHRRAARHFFWKCSNRSGQYATIPSCSSGSDLAVQLRFPSCWDGNRFDSSNHRSHMSYMKRASTGKVYCPRSHPRLLPEFTLTIWYRSDGTTGRWRLASDRMSGMTHPDGSTFHSDWFGAWDREVLGIWTKKCIRWMRNCIWGEIGDGRRLTGGYWYNGPRLVNIPRRPR